MTNVYIDGSGVSRINFLGSVDEHLPAVAYNSGDTVTDNLSYDNYGFAVLSNNKKLEKGEVLSSAVSDSIAEKANQLGLRGQEYSDYVELNIVPAVGTKKDNALNSLVEPIEDSTHEKPSSENTGLNLIDVLKQGSNEQSEIASETLNAINHLTSLFHNQNEILKQANEIAIEFNRIKEVEQHSKDAVNQAVIEGMMSIGQSLGYLPTLIETISLSSDRNAELHNISNSHAMQKNVNDAYEFNHNKDDEQGSVQSLRTISTHLASSASSHAKIVKPIESQGLDAENNIKNFDSENSFEFLSLLDDVGDFVQDSFATVSGVVGDFVDEGTNDFDIFEYILKTRMTEVKDGN